MPLYAASPASKESLAELAGAVDAFDDGWESLQAQAADRLEEVCEVRARSTYLLGDWKALEDVEREVGIKAQFADKLRELQSIAQQQLLFQLKLMREAVLKFDEKVAFLHEHIAQYLPASPMALPGASYMAVQRVIDAVADLMMCYTRDLMCKEVIAHAVVADDAPTDASRLRLQQHAFTCQPYVPDGVVGRTKEVIHAAAALFK